MGWVDKKEEHTYCPKPNTDGVGAGSVWRCDTCHQYWQFHGRVASTFRDNRGQMEYNDTWTRISPPLMKEQHFGAYGYGTGPFDDGT